ncbi:MAG: nucleotide sugar dehydrogenase [Actinobacteria bacterium]|nr:MAG: nucleotide sugar dehydrogenase [Actinomycetota bacterium]
MSVVAVIGTGYVGLTTGAYLAHLGHNVTCADLDPGKIERLTRGEIPIVEAGLEELVREGLDRGRLSFVLGAPRAAAGAEFVFLCVPTPQGADGSADMSYIQAAAREVGPVLDAEAVVINKSTVPVGSTRVVEGALGRTDVFVVSNPEFLREGSAVHDCLHPDRIVIGSDDQAAAIRVAGLFEGIAAPLIVTDPASAETIKYASNAFLATKISFVNAVANLCEAVGADVREVILGIGYDKRIGFEFLKPGPGWGGSCFHPEETVLARRGHEVRHLTFATLFDEVERLGAEGWEVLSWSPGGVGPEFRSVAAVTCRPFRGELLEVRTKMGRRLTVTPDHPFVTGDGAPHPTTTVKLAADLGVDDWLPIAEGFPDLGWEQSTGMPLGTLDAAGLSPDQVIVRCGPVLRAELARAGDQLPPNRRRDVLRCGALRLSELAELGLDLNDLDAPDLAWVGTTTNGTYVPTQIPMDSRFWWITGLYLAEGSISCDGQRRRVTWHFAPHGEEHLVEAVRSYWEGLGVKASVYRRTTSLDVSVSSRILAAWFDHGLRAGVNCYDKRVPDAVWTAGSGDRVALLRGLWDGDGSWSPVAGGPSVVFEYGTVSRSLADGMLRLLAAEGITARLKVGRTAKSTVDTYWLVVSGAEQLDRLPSLFPAEESARIRESVGRQAKRIAPTGYRRAKNASWVRVVSSTRRPYQGPVYSVEVPATGTVVATGGLTAHNCFPKDTRAVIKIAEDAGYDFNLLRGVISVNHEQHERVAAKVARLAGGSVDGQVVAAWGLTFKARTDDLRDSPSLEIIRRLTDQGATVQAYDPTVRGELPGMKVMPDPYAACEGASVLTVLTEWDELRWLDFRKVRELMARPAVVDARNLLDPAAMRRWGFSYEGIGRS